MLATGSIVRITVARIRGYSPGKKTPFIKFLCNNGLRDKPKRPEWR
ncbi:hypothetical protein HMPREF1619_02245 [Klebsiella pneumoniae 909957]|nr:hypothetical protein HMPREF1619_02245 [Klebsiella pneumoniae 909957]